MTVTDLELYRNRNRRDVEVRPLPNFVSLEPATPVLANPKQVRDHSLVTRLVVAIPLWCVFWLLISFVTVMVTTSVFMFAPVWVNNNFVWVRLVFWAPVACMMFGWLALLFTMPVWNNDAWDSRR